MVGKIALKYQKLVTNRNIGSVLWSKMSGIWMVRTFTWWDHLKTRQKSVWKVKFLDFGCPVFRWLLYFNYLCSRLQRRPWSSCSFRTRKMPETKNQKLVNFFLVQYFLYLLQYFLFCPNSLEAQAWFKGGMGLPPHIGQFYIESRKIIFTDPKFVSTVGSEYWTF